MLRLTRVGNREHNMVDFRLGHGGALVELMPVDRRITGLNSALAAT